MRDAEYELVITLRAVKNDAHANLPPVNTYTIKSTSCSLLGRLILLQHVIEVLVQMDDIKHVEYRNTFSSNNDEIQPRPLQLTRLCCDGGTNG